MSELQIVIAIAVAVISLVGMIGGFIARDRYINKQISDGDALIRAKLSEDMRDMHARLDRYREDTVRSADHDKSVARIENMIDRLTGTITTQNQEQTKRYDSILKILAHGKDVD